MAALRMLAVAINRKRLGYVFLVGHQLKEWRTMSKPTKSSLEAAAAMSELIHEFKPDVIVTEQLPRSASLTAFVSQLKSSLSRVAERSSMLNVSVSRSREFANKYEEAQSLSMFFPEIKPWVPEKRRFYEHEPAHLILFDSLALAFKVLRRPSERLAAAMG
ncbi:MAG: hypothetical protein AAGB04_18405 [Pseudomonadota bacterium]